MRMGCADCGCVVESGERISSCGQPDCCCTHLPVGEDRELTIDALAERMKSALESGEPGEFADVLDPNVRWGAPDDASPSCRNRDEVLKWCEHGRAEGTRAHVVSVEAHGDKLLVELRVFSLSDPGGEHERWQVRTSARGRVVDIRGFEDRAEALARLAV